MTSDSGDEPNEVPVDPAAIRKQAFEKAAEIVQQSIDGIADGMQTEEDALTVITLMTALAEIIKKHS